MRQYSSLITWLLLVLGGLLLATVMVSPLVIPAVLGVAFYSMGLYRYVNNKKRAELMSFIIQVESLPEDKRKDAIELMKRRTRPETWHWKLVILVLVFVILVLCYLLVFTYFEFKFTIKPRIDLIEKVFAAIRDSSR